MKYGFIGFGNLAKAIYQGLKGDQNIDFAFFDINNQQIDSIKSFNSLEELSSFADVVWVCVKPQNLVEVLEEIKNYDLTGKVIVSPVAGKSINFFENYFGDCKFINLVGLCRLFHLGTCHSATFWVGSGGRISGIYGFII